MDFKQEAVTLINGLSNELSPSAYDIAWLARVRDDSGKNPRWLDTIDWLLEHQYEDGSWGGNVPYAHDRIICTLSALIALKENDAHNDFGEQIKSGEKYIWQHLHTLHHDLIELVGFELLLPTLLQYACELGLNVPSHTYGYGELRDKKLSLLPIDLFYSPTTSLAFSMEYFLQDPVLDILNKAQQPNGAVANSPATTAWLAIKSRSENERALSYLERVQSLPSYVPPFYPWNNYEIGWVMQHLSYSGVPLTELGTDLPIWQTLKNALQKNGLGFDESCQLYDGDTSSVAIHVLSMGGHEVDPLILKTFEHPERHIFQTFMFERNMSVATNIHALEALACLPDYPNRDKVWDTIIRSLLEHQLYQSFWIDKFHISPFYITAHVMIALMQLRELKIVEYSHSIDWFKHTQHLDGSWGYFGKGTSEETAYTLLALMHYHEYVNPIDLDIIHRGIEFLNRASGEPYADLWIAKTLYSAPAVVDALILAAHERYRNL